MLENKNLNYHTYLYQATLDAEEYDGEGVHVWWLFFVQQKAEYSMLSLFSGLLYYRVISRFTNVIIKTRFCS